MSGPDFFLTKMGRKFYEHDVPAIGNALSRIAKQLELLSNANEQAVEQSSIGRINELNDKIASVSNYINEMRQAWDNNYKGHGAVPYDQAKSVMNVLLRLLRKP